MVGYWTSPAADPKEAAKLAAMRKYVYSRTLQKADWGRVTISRGDNLAGDVAAMRRETDRDITILGSAEVVNAFLRAGLVDEFHLLISSDSARRRHTALSGRLRKTRAEAGQARRRSTRAAW